MVWNFNQREPVFLQIANVIKRCILIGEYPPGSQIPTVRQIAFEASVNPNTVQHALAILEEDGLLHTKNTIGKFVTEDVDALERMRNEVKRKTLENLIRDATSVGIDYEQIIEYVKEKMNG